MVATPIFKQKDDGGASQILPADTTTKKTILTGEAAVNGVSPGGTYIEELSIASTETVNNRAVAFYLNIGGTDYLQNTVLVPINSGFSGSIAKLDVLKHANFVNLPYNEKGNKEWFIPAGAILKWASLSTVATGKELDLSWKGSKTSAV